MAKLTLSFQGAPVGEYPLERDNTTIGRNAENDVHIDNLAVSGHHARIIRVLNDYFFEDLDSTNGSQINGQPVKRHTLRHGDSISVGKHQLRFENDQGETGHNLEKTVFIRPSAMAELRGSSAASGSAPSASPPEPPTHAARQQAHLQILSGPNAGRGIELVKEVTNIGRKGVQVVAITRRNARYYMVAIEGGEGEERYPLINDLPTGPQAWLLHDQDVIEIAGVKMGFFVSG